MARYWKATVSCSDRISDRGCYRPDPHILGEIYACVVGKHAAIRNSKSQFTTPYMAHIDLGGQPLTLNGHGF